MVFDVFYYKSSKRQIHGCGLGWDDETGVKEEVQQAWVCVIGAYLSILLSSFDDVFP